MRLAALQERIRSSLFVVPMAFLLAGAALAVLALQLDRSALDAGDQLPFGLSSTVESARAVLGTIASATITVAGIAFSVSLLVIQLASSQYSPRVVHGLLRDAFTKRVMGFVVGTFTYCLVVLRSVRSPLEEGGAPVVPNVSVAIAVLLGVASILAIIAFISHSARTMDVSRIVARAAREGVDSVRRQWTEEPPERAPADPSAEPPADHLVIRLAHDGWVQQIDHEALVTAAPPGGTVRLEIEVGRYAIRGTPLATVWPTPDEPEAATERARDALVTGTSRTVEQDAGYGVRQLADVALRGLSPSVNDPTTAQDAMFHMGTVLHELLVRHAPADAAPMPDGRTLLRPERADVAELIGVGFDEVRLAATGMPTMCTYLLELLHLLDTAVDPDRSEARAALRHQAALIRAGADRAELLPADRERIRDAHDRRFGPPG